MQENGKVPRSNGIGKSIANFFKNIGHSKDDLRSASPSNRTLSRQRMTSTSTPQFPPLSLDLGTPQADDSMKTPSPQPGEKRPLALVNFNGSSAQDEQLSPATLKLRHELLLKSLDALK